MLGVAIMEQDQKDNNHQTEYLQKRSKLWKVYGGAILFSFIVGFSFLGVKTCVGSASALETLTYRFNFAFLAAILGIITGIAKINLKGKPKNKLVLTAMFYVLFMVFQTIGLIFATSIESGIIFAIVPIIAKIIAGVFLKEGTSIRQNGFVGLSVTAVIVMFVLGATDIAVNFVGLTILLISSLFMAMSNVMMRYVRGVYRPFEITFFIALLGCLVFNIGFIGTLFYQGDLMGYFRPIGGVHFILATAYLGIPSTLISSLLMAFMLANMEAVKATIFGNLSTAISIVAGVIILGEPLAPYHLICTILIIAGVIGLSLPSMGKR